MIASLRILAGLDLVDGHVRVPRVLPIMGEPPRHMRTHFNWPRLGPWLCHSRSMEYDGMDEKHVGE